jgi:hypothetical protein
MPESAPACSRVPGSPDDPGRASWLVVRSEAAQEPSGEVRPGLGRACRNALPGAKAQRRTEDFIQDFQAASDRCVSFGPAAHAVMNLAENTMSRALGQDRADIARLRARYVKRACMPQCEQKVCWAAPVPNVYAARAFFYPAAI